MWHEILGDIQPSDGSAHDAVAMIRYGARNIKVGIGYDGELPDTTLKLAAEVISRLPELDKLAKGVAARDLLETYNNGWNEYDEVQEDSSLKAVLNPRLSESEFIAKLSLSAVNVTGGQMIDFFYEDQGMFWGHSVVVNLRNGVDFRDAYAELFG